MTINTDALTWFFVVFCSAYNSFLVIAFLLLRRRARSAVTGKSVPGKAVNHFTLVIPARDEALVIEQTVRSLWAALTAGLSDLRWELFVIDDDSHDETANILARLQTEFGERLMVLHRQPPACREGKAAALNVAVSYLKARFPKRLEGGWVVGVFDADAACEPALFSQVAALFENGADAVQCAVRICNRQKWLPRFQDAEFLAFSAVTQVVRNATTGAVALGGNAQFVRFLSLERVREKAGFYWHPLALTEDLNLGNWLHRIGARIAFCPAAVYQQGIEACRPLIRQRNRWAWGTIQAWWWHLSDQRFWLSPMPLARKLDLGYYLSFWLVPVVVASSWLLFFASWVFGLPIASSFPAWLLLANSFSFLPLIVVGLRAGGWNWGQSLVLAVGTIVYSYHWLIPIGYGVFAMVSQRRPKWAKTKRIMQIEQG